MTNYRHQHYVPQWYQKRFLEDGSSENVLWRLRLRPRHIVDGQGKRRRLRDLERRPISRCFVEEDIYTVRLPGSDRTEIEELLFGRIDDWGSRAVAYWADFHHPAVDERSLTHLMLYMSSQKLRTPKGLKWLASSLNSDANHTLGAMVTLRDMHAAIWMECIW